VTQDIDLYRGMPIVYSVGNFVMKETDNDHQRKAWVLHLDLDRQGVKGLDTEGVQIDFNGLPSPAQPGAMPCWRRGDTHIRSMGGCTATVSAKPAAPARLR